MLGVSEEEGDLAAELFKLLHAHHKFHLLALCGLDLDHDLRTEDLIQIVGREDDINLPLARDEIQPARLLRQSACLLLGGLGVQALGLVVGEQADLLVVLSVPEILFGFYGVLYLFGELEDLQLGNLLPGGAPEERVYGA